MNSAIIHSVFQIKDQSFFTMLSCPHANIQLEIENPYMYVRTTVCVYVCLFRAIPLAYGSSQARGEIGAVAASLHYSHSNAGSEPHL